MKTITKSALTIAVLATLTAGHASAGLITAGYDLLETSPTTTFLGQNFQGVPLVYYDFGGSIGGKYVDSTDTIIHRLSSQPTGLLPTTTIPVEMVSLQLQSVAPFDPDGPGGAPLATYFVTLQSNRSLLEGGPGTPTTGNLLNLDESSPGVGGFFDSFFDVYFDVRPFALNGPIVLSSNLTLTQTGGTWTHPAPSGIVLIDGVNHNLNGVNENTDFYPGPLTESHPSGAMHDVIPAAIPEPSVTGLFALALALLAFFRMRSRRTRFAE